MKLGFGLPVSGGWATPATQRQVAARADELGYASLWCFQRLVVPAQPRDDYPPAPGKPWPPAFQFALDPTVSLAHVAGATEGIRLGFAVLNFPFYSPALLAKQVATLDYVSGGRTVLGLGLGWSRDEYQAVGVPFRQRGARMDDFVDCLRAIWAGETGEHQGPYYAMPPGRVDPPPVQQPHPPILIGGYGAAAIERTVARGDGFVGGNVGFDDVEWIVRGIRERAAATDHDPADLELVCRGSVVWHEHDQGDQRRPLQGSRDEILADIARYERAGVTELFLDANIDPSVGGPDAPVDHAIERGRTVLEELAPQRLGRWQRS